ncbi:MAG: hypothetical protein ABI639_15300 [Thermoanaerobaculia bacterium]
MKDHENLATLLTRLGGAYYVLIALMQLFLSAFSYLSEGHNSVGPDPLDRVTISGTYLLVGVLLIVFSRELARLFARGLD